MFGAKFSLSMYTEPWSLETNCENSMLHLQVLANVEFSIVLLGSNIICGHHITGFENFSIKLTS